MGFEGHVFDMIARSRQNREMVRARRERTRKIRELYTIHYNRKTTAEQPPANLKALKEEIRRELQARRRKALITTGILIAVLIAVVSFWLFNFRPLDVFTATFLR